MTQAEYDAEVSVIENEQARLRMLLSVAPLVPKEWALSGFEFKRRMDILDSTLDRLKKQLRFSKFMFAERMRAKAAKKSERMDARLDVKAGFRELWSDVDEELAIKLRQNGFTVRCIGIKRWQVKSS